MNDQKSKIKEVLKNYRIFVLLALYIIYATSKKLPFEYFIIGFLMVSYVTIKLLKEKRIEHIISLRGKELNIEELERRKEIEKIKKDEITMEAFKNVLEKYDKNLSRFLEHIINKGKLKLENLEKRLSEVEEKIFFIIGTSENPTDNMKKALRMLGYKDGSTIFRVCMENIIKEKYKDRIEIIKIKKPTSTSSFIAIVRDRKIDFKKLFDIIRFCIPNLYICTIFNIPLWLVTGASMTSGW